MAVSRDLDLGKIEWVEWENRHGATMAHAVDPGSEQRTGLKRTVTGAIIPPSAVPAKANTARDAFSTQVLERIAQVQAERAGAEQEKAAKKQAADEAKAAKLAERAEAQKEAAAKREAAKAAKDKEKAEKAASRVSAAAEKAPAEPAAATGKLKKSGAEFLVLNAEGVEVGRLDADKLDTKAGGIQLVITEKVWAVTQKGKKVAQGNIAKPKTKK